LGVETVTAFTVMVVCVGGVVVLAVGAAVIVAPSPRATALADTVPDTATAAPAPVTFACAMVAGRVRDAALALNVVGVPEMATVTTVLLVRVADPTVSPAGNPVIPVKFAPVMGLAYVPLLNV